MSTALNLLLEMGRLLGLNWITINSTFTDFLVLDLTYSKVIIPLFTSAPFPKDDLESLVYIVIHLVTGGEVFKSKSKLCTYDEKIRYYFEIKNKLVVEKVLKSHPENFSQFYHMVN